METSVNRFVSWDWSVGLVGACAMLLAIAITGCSSSPAEFQGTTLTSGSPATPFELTDHFGQRVGLSDYDGRVVLLTFLYTNCPDVCPIVTGQLRKAHAALDADADEVSFVAISVDPERDSVEEARAYSEKWEMAKKWAFLVGDREELSPIWRAYYLDPAVVESLRENGEAHTDETRSRGGVEALRQGLEERYRVIHSTPVYLIDREGIMRVAFTPPLDVDALVHDVRLLVN